jgi:hypothetical protein
VNTTTTTTTSLSPALLSILVRLLSSSPLRLVYPRSPLALCLRHADLPFHVLM